MPRLSEQELAELDRLGAAATGVPWGYGSTPGYLRMGQAADGRSRIGDPLTIRSPEHTEEIATVWNYLLPTEANAQIICAARNALPNLLAAYREAVAALEKGQRALDLAIGVANVWVVTRGNPLSQDDDDAVKAGIEAMREALRDGGAAGSSGA